MTKKYLNVKAFETQHRWLFSATLVNTFLKKIVIQGLTNIKYTHITLPCSNVAK